MKKRIVQGIGFAILGLCIGWAYGQTPTHTVTLTVTSPDASSAAPGTATIQRATGACPASGVPSSGTTLTSTLAVPGTANFTDSTVVGGSTYCYWASLKTAGGGSGVSNTFLGTITVSVNLSGTVQ
jgi:hypothetical protein